MSGTNTDVPSMTSADLPVPVAPEDYERCPVTGILHRIGDKWTLLVLALVPDRARVEIAAARRRVVQRSPQAPHPAKTAQVTQMAR